ncbi:hypothetical protein RvY_08915-2 [Ramazzottius varieornatus]|uniref:Uncharacterized protein n=1 Tax=Ramazzottius varieornatus TaxID=947166 RepID=A0A1D1V7K9_RAMVA|nr:hypothetical protein RvY_08915-2 [Ramazzottius varieornatus]
MRSWNEKRSPYPSRKDLPWNGRSKTSKSPKPKPNKEVDLDDPAIFACDFEDPPALSHATAKRFFSRCINYALRNDISLWILLVYVLYRSALWNLLYRNSTLFTGIHDLSEAPFICYRNLI